MSMAPMEEPSQEASPDVELPPGVTHESHLPDGVTQGPKTLRAFRKVLANTLVANVTSSYLWFALTLWEIGRAHV